MEKCLWIKEGKTTVLDQKLLKTYLLNFLFSLMYFTGNNAAYLYVFEEDPSSAPLRLHAWCLLAADGTQNPHALHR